MLFLFFQYGLDVVLIKWISIGFEAILEKNPNLTLLGEGVVAELEGGELLHSLESGGVRSGRL